ncbi:trypsin-like serine peptidase [Actinomadura barringtoniae]|nr:trypsin-like peptidase domain-containing protein [Actinomadura barringtoniae]
MRLRRTAGVIGPAAVVVIAVSPSSAAGARPPVAEPAVHSVQATAARIRAYWTPERRAAAAAGQAGALWTGGGAVARTTGKVFFTIGGRDFLCSGSTVRSANRDVVVTAGHCVKDGKGAWADNWIFVPGYRDGDSPYGGYTARRMFTPDQWSEHADGDFDVAMVAVAQADGRHVVDVAGGQRLAFGGPREAHTHAFGYPASGRWNGKRLAYCDGTPAPDRHAGTTGRGLRCDLTTGSSGGPWLTGLDPATGLGTVVSVNSFKYADDHATMYGPHFGDAVRRAYDQAQNA